MVSNLLPQARLPISEDGKTFSLPWLRFFQGLSSGSIDPAVIAALEAEIAAAEAAAAAAQVTADEALALAEEADAGISPSYGIEFAALDEPWQAVNSSVPMSIMMGMDGEPGQDGIGLPGVAGANGTIGRDGAPGIGIPGQDGEPGQDCSMISLPIATATQFGIGRGDGTTISTTNGVNSVIGNPAALVYEDGTVPAGNTIANTTADTAFTSSYTIAANSLAVGSVISLRLFGVFSTALAAPTLVFNIKLNGTTILTTGTIGSLVGSTTNDGWDVEADMIVTAIGSGTSGQIEAQGVCELDTSVGSASVTNMTRTTKFALDTTIAQTLTCTVQWGTASASNTITLRTMTVNIQRSGAIPGQSGLILLEQHTASGSATLDFTTFASSLYDEYLMELVSIIPVTNSVVPRLLVSTNGGSSWSSSTYDWQAWGQDSSGGTGGGFNNSDSAFTINDGAGMSSTTSGTFNGTLRIFNILNSTQYFSYLADVVGFYSDSKWRRQWIGGRWKTASPVNALRFQCSSGNIASGIIRIYGFCR